MVNPIRFMLAQKYDESRATWPLIAEPKLDGSRFQIHIGPGNGRKGYRVLQRSGVDYTKKLGFIAEQLVKMTKAKYPKGVFFDGEVFAEDWSTTQSLVKTERDIDRSDLKFYAFDMCIMGKPAELTARRKNLKKLLNTAKAPNVKLLVGYPVKSHEEATAMYKTFLDHGFEGAMLKNPNGNYTRSRSWAWMKFKPWATTEGVIYDGDEGKNSFIGMLGNLKLMMPDKTTVKVGGGFSHAQRKDIWEYWDEYEGATVEFKYQDDPVKVARYRFPIFLRFHDHKLLGRAEKRQEKWLVDYMDELEIENEHKNS